MANVYKASVKSPTAAAFNPYYALSPNQGVDIAKRWAGNISLGLYCETPIGRSIIDTTVDHVIGSGLRPESAPENAILGVSEETLRKFQKTVEAYFRLWANDKSNDFYGKSTFYEQQILFTRSMLITGDCLQHRHIVRKGNMYFPVVQNISGRLVGNPQNGMDTKQLAGGVEVDEYGREIAYWIRTIDEYLNDTPEARRYAKYNARGREVFDLIPYGIVEPGQRRGVSILEAVKDKILQITRYDDATAAKAIVQAIFTMFIEQDVNGDVSAEDTALEKIKGLALGTDGQQIIRPEGAGGQNIIRPDLAPEASDDITLGTGVIIQGEPGEKPNIVESKTPSTAYSDYMGRNLDLIGAATGNPKEILLGSYSSSYSASRATIIGAEKAYSTTRNNLAVKYCQPVYEMFVECLVRQGIVDAPGFTESPIMRKAWCACEWKGPVVTHIDPVKEVSAKVLAINAGLETREHAIHDLWNGADFDETVHRLATEQQTIDSLGLQLTTGNQQDATDRDGDGMTNEGE